MLKSFLKLFYWVPFLGMIIREVLEGPDEAKYVFCAKLVMAVVLAVAVFGFHAFVAIMLTAVAVMFVIIFDITRDDRPSPGVSETPSAG